jgi:hypothetical protein
MNNEIPDFPPEEDSPMKAAIERATARASNMQTHLANSTVKQSMDHGRSFEVGPRLQSVLLWAVICTAGALAWVLR